jgi:hypothetical protein
MPDEIRDEREYTREEMREACRNNYNAALLEARRAAIEMAKSPASNGGRLIHCDRIDVMELLINLGVLGVVLLLLAVIIGGPAWVVYQACTGPARPMERILAIEAHYRAIARFKLEQRHARRPVAPYFGPYY